MLNTEQHLHLQRILIERKRRLLTVYQAHDGQTYAVSRPAGHWRTPKYDQRHLLDLSAPTMVQIVHTTGASY